jgi:hypothetical protein
MRPIRTVALARLLVSSDACVGRDWWVATCRSSRAAGPCSHSVDPFQTWTAYTLGARYGLETDRRRR